MSCERTYEMPESVDAVQPLPSHNDTEALMNQVDLLVNRIGYSNPSRPEVFSGMLRSLLAKARPNIKELNMLRGVVKQLSQSVKDWPGRRRG